MEIQRYMLILKSRKWVVILTTIVTLAVVTVGSVSVTPTYSASAMVRVTTGLAGSVTNTDLNYAERLIQTYVQLLKSRPFMEEVIKRLDLPISSEDLAETIKVEAVTDTELIKINVESISPQQAAAIANTLADLLVEQGQKMYYGQGKSAREILQEQVTVLEEQLRQDRALLVTLSSPTPDLNQIQDATLQDLTTKIRAEEQTYTTLLSQYDRARLDEAMRANSIGIVEPAVVPEAPSKPNLKLNIALGALVGLLGGIGLAFLFENLSPMLHSTSDLAQAAGVPLLGRVPNFEIKAGDQQTAIFLNNSDIQSPAADSFRVLSASTLAFMSETHLKTILITSAEPGVGKSTVLANLAVAMAEAGRQIIVVDGDLQRPCLHQIFGLAIEPGLSDLLLNPAQLDLAVQPTKMKGIRAIAVGSTCFRSSKYLNAPVISEIIDQLAKDADIVLWDSPPLLAAAEAALLAPLADGVVLIVERAQTQQEAIQAACQQLVGVKAKLLGIIVNRVERDTRYNYFYNHQRPAKDRWWARMPKGLRHVASSYQGKEIFNGKKK